MLGWVFDMGLAERIAGYERPRIGAYCKMCVLLEDLPADDRDALVAGLADPSMSNAGLAKILSAEGYQMADSTVRRHRKSECKQS
jgi:hypothetical protein